MRTILIPAYNEAASIAGVVSHCQRWYEQYPILVVDNASEDETRSLALSLGARVVSCEKRGYSNALKKGYEWALENGVTELVQLDADGQHPASAIGPLFDNLKNCDWTIASRHRLGCCGNIERRFASWAIGPLLRLECKNELHDWSSGMWGLNRKSIEFLAQTLPLRTMDANLRILASRSGLDIRELPVAMASRDAGESMHSGFEGIKNLINSAVQAWRVSH